MSFVALPQGTRILGTVGEYVNIRVLLKMAVKMVSHFLPAPRVKSVNFFTTRVHSCEWIYCYDICHVPRLEILT